MELRAKIKRAYLDEILAGRKLREYRQIEGFYLVDEDERVVKVDVVNVRMVAGDWESYMKKKYPDVTFKTEPVGHPATYIYSFDIRNPVLLSKGKPKPRTSGLLDNI